MGDVSTRTVREREWRNRRLNISETANELGVSRRTIQRYVAAGKLEKGEDGKVSLNAAVSQVARAKYGPGRPPGNKDTYLLTNQKHFPNLARERALPFVGPNGLQNLRATLSWVRFRHNERGKLDVYCNALLDELSRVQKTIERNRKRSLGE